MLEKNALRKWEKSHQVQIHTELMGSILDRDTSSIQVWSKSVQQFLCDPSNKPTNKQMDH